ncbi:MAG: hypothetical protein PHQ19_07735 [Candidatus Krumholzibacteria bacterium]|nr:hypothetical protein [Candidatus Krumholzibacteria bacterium]
MQNGFPARGAIDRAERTIRRIRDVRSCRIVTGADGEIAEVHVVAGGGRPPKKIARDVESVLKAEAGIDIDHRKIGVVLLEEHQGEDSAQAGPPREEPGIHGFPEIRDDLEILEDFSRVELRSVSVLVESGAVSAEVSLSRDGQVASGRHTARRGEAPPFAAAARAAALALAELLDEQFHLCLTDIREFEIDGRKALAAVVALVDGRDTKRFTGCAFAGDDPGEAAVLAVLDAVNRPFGRWKSRRETHYRIR